MHCLSFLQTKQRVFPRRQANKIFSLKHELFKSTYAIFKCSLYHPPPGSTPYLVRNLAEALLLLFMRYFVSPRPRIASPAMAFRSGQNYMNFANILKLYTEHIKSLDMKSNRANSSSNLKK